MLKQIETSDAIIYGMGSLYTSIVPNLILRDVGEAIAQRNCPKILMFNGSIDRETSGMTATDYILAIVDALNRKHTEYAIDFHVSDYVTHILTPDGGQFIVDDDALKAASLTRDKAIIVKSEVSRKFTDGKKKKKKKEKTANGRYVPAELVKAVVAVVEDFTEKKNSVARDEEEHDGEVINGEENVEENEERDEEEYSSSVEASAR